MNTIINHVFSKLRQTKLNDSSNKEGVIRTFVVMPSSYHRTLLQPSLSSYSCFRYSYRCPRHNLLPSITTPYFSYTNTPFFKSLKHCRPQKPPVVSGPADYDQTWFVCAVILIFVQFGLFYVSRYLSTYLRNHVYIQRATRQILMKLHFREVTYGIHHWVGSTSRIRNKTCTLHRIKQFF